MIVGGESGPQARPMAADWAKEIRDRCLGLGVPFFFKQWGGVCKSKTGRLLDGRTWDEMPLDRRRCGKIGVDISAPSRANDRLLRGCSSSSKWRWCNDNSRLLPLG
jgi:hypothetical protein